MRVLIACEFSGIVRDAFIARGHDAMSCDLLPTERPGPHYQGDVRDILGNGWDLMIAHPPCTYLCRHGARWFGHPKHADRELRQADAVCFFVALWHVGIPRVCIENPVGYMNSHWQKPTQCIQPWQFGHDYSKRTCLWLRNLPPLTPTNVVELTYVTTPNGQRFTRGWYEMPRTSKARSRTFPGIAAAMAEQWGSLSTPPGGERRGDTVAVSRTDPAAGGTTQPAAARVSLRRPALDGCAGAATNQGDAK